MEHIGDWNLFGCTHLHTEKRENVLGLFLVLLHCFALPNANVVSVRNFFLAYLLPRSAKTWTITAQALRPYDGSYLGT